MLEGIDRLYSIARLVAQDADIAEDAVQESLVRCWRDLPSLRDVERFDPWLRRLLLNSVTEEFRKRRRFEANLRVVRLEPSVADASGSLADRDEIQRAFRVLSLEHRTVLVLHHYLGMSVAEVARSVGIPPGTAKSRLHYANAALRATLEADARQDPTGKVSA
jgi:RNA polymerase sigma-70 factor (ECF subfamily)